MKSKTLLLIYLFISLLICVYMNRLFTVQEVVADQEENLVIGYFLYTQGIFGFNVDDTGKPIPSNYREPLPPIVNALFMYAHPGIDKSVSRPSVNGGENQKKVKQVNLVWVMLLQLGVGYLIWILTKNKFFPFIGLLLLLVYFIRFGNHFDTFWTELHAATLMIWASVFLKKALDSESLRHYLVFGIIFGLLILTKASFFYLSILVPVVLLYLFSFKKGIKYSLLFVAGALFMVAPWLIRNYLTFNKFELTNRGGMTITNRMYLDQMSSEEIKGAIYLWGPEIYQDLVRKTTLGVSVQDTSLGGKYHSLVRSKFIDGLAIENGMPERTIGYFAKVRAQKRMLENKYSHLGPRQSSLKAQQVMKSESIEWILAHPFQHFSMSPLFAWRGMWCFPNSTIPLLNDKIQKYIHEVLNFLSYLLLVIFFVVGIIKKKTILISFTLIPISLLTFYTMISHYLPRYSESLIPSMLIALTLFLFYLYEKYLRIFLQRLKHSKMDLPAI